VSCKDHSCLIVTNHMSGPWRIASRGSGKRHGDAIKEHIPAIALGIVVMNSVDRFSLGHVERSQESQGSGIRHLDKMFSREGLGKAPGTFARRVPQTSIISTAPYKQHFIKTGPLKDEVTPELNLVPPQVLVVPYPDNQAVFLGEGFDLISSQRRMLNCVTPGDPQRVDFRNKDLSLSEVTDEESMYRKLNMSMTARGSYAGYPRTLWMLSARSTCWDGSKPERDHRPAMFAVSAALQPSTG
jgi:hypothetical protein